MFDDHNKKRADDAEAMWLGTVVAAKKSQSDHEITLDALDAIKERLSSEVVELVSMTADRDAYKALADALMYENKHPEVERRFSDPTAYDQRMHLMEDVHRHSWSEIINAKKHAAIGLKGETIDKARKKSLEVVRSYQQIAKSLGDAPLFRGPIQKTQTKKPSITITNEIMDALGLKINK